MKLPVIQGLIKRRILVNYRVDPDVMKRQLPSRFSPKLQGAHAVAGICLIRLEEIRPRMVPSFAGIASENAAHRIAVTWKSPKGQEKEGVFIPRRDTGSTMNHLAGGRVFPGEHHKAGFQIEETPGSIDLRMRSDDGKVAVRVAGTFGGALPKGSCFPDIEAASRFFEPGALGYSVTKDPKRLDGIELRTKSWKIEALQVSEVHSSYFADETKFPKGSAVFDCALLMRDIAHEWHGSEDLYV
jgi:hypothetical protein